MLDFLFHLFHYKQNGELKRRKDVLTLYKEWFPKESYPDLALVLENMERDCEMYLVDVTSATSLPNLRQQVNDLRLNLNAS